MPNCCGTSNGTLSFIASHCSALQGLDALGYEIVSTGGSATAIEREGVPVVRVEQLTGFPEMLDGKRDM